MPEITYVPVAEFEPADLSRCGDGLFYSRRLGPLRNVLVSTSEEARFAVYLDDPKGASVHPLPAGESRSEVGILWPKPEIEVDTTTIFDPDREQEMFGDLILTPRPAIVGRMTESWSDDGRRVLLWGDESQSGKPVGFRSWRLVSAVADHRRVVFERGGAKIDPTA